MTQKFASLFDVSCPIIGMIHLEALSGTPRNTKSPKQIIQHALGEVQIYKKAGIDALMIENMHDVPYLKTAVGHEINAIMSIIGYEIKRQSSLPCGIQILSSANESAMAAAHAAGLDFIRAEGFVYGHLADEGYIDACAGDLLRYRRQLGAGNIAILTDIKKKHSSHSITVDTSIGEMAKTAEFFLSDGIIVTGTSTGTPVDQESLSEVRLSTDLPIIAGSGVNIDNVADYMNSCDALIVGSHFKKEGYWGNELDEERVNTFMKKVRTIRNK